MKLIIAGGRDYKPTAGDVEFLDLLYKIFKITEVVSGGASGADAFGEQWAGERCISIKRFPADWEAHGRFAGPIRNAQMAAYADALVAFPGGAGTRNMIKEAKANNLRIIDLS